MSAPHRGLLRWCSSLAIVLAVHGVLVSVALWWTARAPVPPQALAPDALMVELAAAPEAPPVPPRALPPGPLMRQQKMAEPEPSPAPMPELTLPADDTAQTHATRRREVVERAEATDTQDVAQSLAPPSIQAQEATRYAAAQTVTGSPGDAAATWQARLLGHLQQFRRYPRQAERLRQQGVAYVRFSVDRQGNASHVRIGRSSGHPLLDEETLATVQRGSPLPAPPSDVEGDPVEVMVPVEFFLHRR